MLAQVKRRKLLIMLGKSKKNESHTWQVIDKIDQWLKTYPAATEKQLAKYFLNHLIDFQQIIPGYGSTCFESEKAKLETMKELAIHLTHLTHV